MSPRALEMARLYLRDSASLKEIGRRFGCSSETVRNVLDAQGLRERPTRHQPLNLYALYWCGFGLDFLADVTGRSASEVWREIEEVRHGR